MKKKQIVCSQCSTENRTTAKFCANCGYALASGGLLAVEPEVGSDAEAQPVAATPAQAQPELQVETPAESDVSDDIVSPPAARHNAAATKELKDAMTFIQLASGRVMNQRYTVLHPLGKGGMGAVYLASETIANRQRQVVLKEMLEYYDAGDPEGEQKARQRFEAEAATLASLNFSGIPQIFDFFSDGGRNYIVMQFIEGRNLESGLTRLDDEANLVSGKPYSAEEVRRWGIQVCKVLENLAAQNIVHMDVKPPNLILDKSGDVWLVDFGTAKAQWVMHSTGKVGMQKSSVYGTAGYAPPEQYVGKAEPRSDVYALAATMYHLLTDDDPRSHPFKFPKLDDLPEDIASALQSALHQDVNQRITAADFRQMLDVRTTGKLPFRWEHGTVCYDPRELVTPANQNWAEAVRYFAGDAWEIWLKGLHRNDVLSILQEAKNKYADPNQALDAFLRRLDRKLPPPRLGVDQIALSAGTVRQGEKATLTLQLFNQGGGWLSGKFTGLPSWVQIDGARREGKGKTTGPQTVNFGLRDQLAVKVDVAPAHLPARVAPHMAQFTVDAGDAGSLQIPIHVIVRPAFFLKTWYGKATVALTALVLIFAMLFLMETRWLGWITIRMDSLVQGTSRFGILFTSDRSGKREIYRMTSSGVEQITRTPAQGESWGPVPEPSYGGVLFVSNRDGKFEIYRLSSAGSERVTNTPGDGESWSPVAASDGSILFTSNRDGRRDIYRIKPDHTSERVTYTPGGAESWSPVMGRNGELLFVSNRDGQPEIYRLDANGTERITNTPNGGMSISPVLEPDGDILFISNRDGPWEIYRLSPSGLDRLTETTDGSENMAAFPELGGAILFSSNRDGTWEIYRWMNGEIIQVTDTSDGGSWLLRE